MPVYTVHEAETQLAKLIEHAGRGEEVVIALGNQPIAKIVAFEEKPKAKRQPGTLKGSICIHESFYEPMTDAEIREIEEGHLGDPLRQPLAGRADEASSPPDKPKREPGGFEGQIIVHESFFEPMTEEELALWEGSAAVEPPRQNNKHGA